MRETLFENDDIHVEEDASLRVIIVARKSTRASSPDALAATYQRALAAMRPEHVRYGLVVDSRTPIGRNDEDFETPMRELQHRVTSQFAAVVFVVSTAAGELQARRMGRESGQEPVVVRDLDEAIARASRGAH